MDKNDKVVRGAAMGQSETVAALQELMEKFQSGEITCAAIRLFRPDGTWDDIALGGDEQEQAEALTNLRHAHERAN
ncbi:MAG: hypothetical protein H7255_15140 [Ramlibacter sp.]|nr:hypothetical protein [Ramlibacter sp.]